MQKDLYGYLSGVIRNSGGVAMEIGGIGTHVHLLVEISNLDRFTAMVRNTKSSSTIWLKKNYPECREFAWQDGFGSFSVSFSRLERLREYIQKQEEHHQKQTFEDEYRGLLNKHQVGYDERFIFD